MSNKTVLTSYNTTYSNLIDTLQEKSASIASEVSTQSDLMAQIQNALEGKAAGGSGGTAVHSGTSAPTNDIGSDGDVYLVVSE